MKGIAASRRGFLKFGAGAAVAGPSAAKSVLETPLVAAGMGGIQSAAPMGLGLGAVVEASDYGEDGEYTLAGAQKRIKHLIGKAHLHSSQNKKELAKTRREVVGGEAYLRIEELRIDGMRSVSPSYKARMILDSYVEARMKRKQVRLTIEVDEIIEKYPALSMLIGSRGDDA